MHFNDAPEGLQTTLKRAEEEFRRRKALSPAIHAQYGITTDIQYLSRATGTSIRQRIEHEMLQAVRKGCLWVAVACEVKEKAREIGGEQQIDADDLREYIMVLYHEPKRAIMGLRHLHSTVSRNLTSGWQLIETSREEEIEIYTKMGMTIHDFRLSDPFAKYRFLEQRADALIANAGPVPNVP